MNKVKGFISGCRVFIRGLKVLIGIKPFARGDRNLAMATKFIQMARAMGGARGVGVARQQAINAIDDVLKEGFKKNPLAKEEDLLKPFLITPDFMDLLKALDLGERDLRFFAGEALKKRGKNEQS